MKILLSVIFKKSTILLLLFTFIQTTTVLAETTATVCSKLIDASEPLQCDTGSIDGAGTARIDRDASNFPSGLDSKTCSFLFWVKNKNSIIESEAISFEYTDTGDDQTLTAIYDCFGGGSCPAEYKDNICNRIVLTSFDISNEIKLKDIPFITEVLPVESKGNCDTNSPCSTKINALVKQVTASQSIENQDFLEWKGHPQQGRTLNIDVESGSFYAVYKDRELTLTVPKDFCKNFPDYCPPPSIPEICKYIDGLTSGGLGECGCGGGNLNLCDSINARLDGTLINIPSELIFNPLIKLMKE